MSDIQELICVTCPKGCTLKVKQENGEIVVLDKGCKRGETYAVCELTDPRRMVASSVKVKGGLHPLLPVYTSAPFPKPMIMQLTEELRKLELDAPVAIKQVIIANVLGTGVDIIASRDMPRVV